MNKYMKQVKITLQKTNNAINMEIKDSRDSADAFRQIFPADMIDVHEQFCCIFMDQKGCTKGWFLASQGGINYSVVDVRTIFAAALNCLATSILICHNHPSGQLNPSKEDIAMTKKIKEAGEILQIRLMDHIVLTETGYTSFNDEGLL